MNSSIDSDSENVREAGGKKPDVGFLFADYSHFLALGFGSGLAPRAPGTVGTIAAIPLWLLLATQSFLTQIALIAIAFLFGIYLCRKTADALGVHDHGAIVWDEFVGLWLTLALLPAGWLWIVGGFLLFRFFDIVKPWPIAYLDRHIDGGMGIMIDDVVAAVFAATTMWLLIYLWSLLF